jgi:hypothetical protein
MNDLGKEFERKSKSGVFDHGPILADTTVEITIPAL